MSKLTRVSLFVLPMLLLLGACKKSQFDEYYERPAGLSDPIYQQLQTKGNFTSILALIDKSGYKTTLSSGGYWTFFAPDDNAFKAYFTEKGISGVDKIDSVTARKIVTYNLIYNAYRKDQLSLALSPATGTTTPVNYNVAYKRKTAYYDFVYKETVKGKSMNVVASNIPGGYNTTDNGNKFYPYFNDDVLTSLNLSAADYNTFYPATPFAGFNIPNGKVTEKDISAENGIIHVVNKVVTPLNNLDQYIAGNPNYSEFKSLLDKAATYQRNDALTHRNQVLTGSADSVYVKVYNASLAFSPNNESYLGSALSSQIAGYTMFVPTNAELKAYEKSILVNYLTFDAAPPTVLYSLLNAHMWMTDVWPSKVATTLNSQSEPPTFTSGNIVDKQLLSNGFFYGTNAVQDANVFRTIYGKSFLDPKYTLMTRALDAEVKFVIVIPQSKYTMFLMSNNSLIDAGYNYYEDYAQWGYLKPGTTGTPDRSTNARDRIYRIIQTAVLPTPNGELDNLSGSGIVEAYNGEYVKYNNNKIVASGNEEAGTSLSIDSVKTTANGKVYYVNGALTFAETTVAQRLDKLATADPNNFSYFNNYLKNSPIYNGGDFSILNVALGSFYTLFVPTNAAIAQAIKDGMLPGTVSGSTVTPNYTSTATADIDKVSKFIYYHFLDKNTVVTDGKKLGVYPTLLKNANGDVLYLTLSGGLNSLSLKDSYNRTSTVNLATSNNLSNRVVIHSINNYLKYNEN